MKSNRKNNLLANFVIFWLFFYVIFAERFVLKIETGGKGIVSILVLINFLLVFYILLKSKGKALGVFKSKFFIFWWPFVILSILLPVLGVLFRGYPIRTIVQLNLISEISFVILGYWISKRITSWKLIFERYLLAATVIEFIYSLIQFLYQTGFIPQTFWYPFYLWDLNSQLLYASPIFGRSIGTFINPNGLGFWAVVSFGLALYLAEGYSKYILIVLSFLTLLLSQSRGCLFGIVFSLVTILTIQLLKIKKFSFKKFFKAYALFFLTMIIGVSVVYFNLIDFKIFERIKSGFKVLVYGPSADQNFLLRTYVWKDSIQFFTKNFLGTFGPPELMLNLAVDNDWVRLLLQGSIIYVASFLLMLIGGILIGKLNKTKEGGFLLYMSLLLPITAISETPTIYIPMAIYWFIMGIMLEYIRYQKLSFHR